MNSPLLPAFRSSGTETDLSLLIVPKSSRNRWVGMQGESLKLTITAPPSDGAANAAVIAFVADSLQLPKKGVRLKSGVASRRKTVTIALEITETIRRLSCHLENKQ